MLLIEQTKVPDGALPLGAFKDHLKVGSGFGAPDGQDAVLLTCLRGAMASVEARTGKSVIERRFRWRITAWRDLGRQVLPVAPVQAIEEVRVVSLSGQATVIDPGAWRLEPDTHRPALVARGLVLPTIPVGGAAEVVFDAGYGPAWSDVPADLAQAVMMLAAHLYETRGADATPALPESIAALLAPHRLVRLFGGGR